MGLLDDFSSFVKTPEGIGLLSAVAGGLAGAQRGAPLNSIGRAGLAGLTGYANAQDRQAQQAEQEFAKQYKQMQMGEIQRKTLKDKQREELIATLPLEQQQALGLGLGFDKIWERNNPDPNKLTREDELRLQSRLRMDEREYAAKLAAQNRVPAQPPQPYFSPASDATLGLGTFDHRTGKYAFPDKPLVKPADSPTLQGSIAGAKEAAKTEAEERTKATLDAPRVVDNAEIALKYSDELLKHPGFGIAVGKSAMLGTQKIPGTPGYDFINRLDQLKGGAFLEAFNTLKGGGQITEVEGKKATDAIARMDNATSEPEFRAAVKDYQDVIRKGMNRAKMKAKPVSPVQQPQQGGVKFLGFE